MQTPSHFCACRRGVFHGKSGWGQAIRGTFGAMLWAGECSTAPLMRWLLLPFLLVVPLPAGRDPAHCRRPARGHRLLCLLRHGETPANQAPLLTQWVQLLTEQLDSLHLIFHLTDPFPNLLWPIQVVCVSRGFGNVLGWAAEDVIGKASKSSAQPCAMCLRH